MAVAPAASPPGNGRRGLKQRQLLRRTHDYRGIASRQREAWIETKFQWAPLLQGVASPPGNGRRGLKLKFSGGFAPKV